LENLEIENIINLMEPKIIKVHTNTSFQERDDLKQEICLKMIEVIKKEIIKEVPGFWELKELYDKNVCL
jgi:uncharacterized FlaG/YvyC family protein